MIKNIIATSLDLINVILKRKVVAQNKEHLKKLINYSIKLSGYNCDLNHIDVSLITDMSNLFYNSNFNGDISKWDTSNVTNMKYMFYFSKFNGNISQWDTSHVENMNGMFRSSQFNGDISQWKPYVLNVCKDMFRACEAPVPWWYSEDASEIVQKLKAHDLAQTLEKELPVKVKAKKLKI